MAVPVTPAAASSGGIQAECNKIGQWHLYRQMELIRYAQPLLRNLGQLARIDPSLGMAEFISNSAIWPAIRLNRRA